MSKIPPASIYIRPMEESDIQALLRWNKNTSESFLHQWSGFSAYQYPLTAEQIRARLALPSCRLIAAVFQGETVAAAEIDGAEASEPLEPSQEAAISSASSCLHAPVQNRFPYRSIQRSSLFPAACSSQNGELPILQPHPFRYVLTYIYENRKDSAIRLLPAYS